ncbi:hypothetical protein BH09BAC2_BH09BAC2_17870 [soil metagenome]
MTNKQHIRIYSLRNWVVILLMLTAVFSCSKKVETVQITPATGLIQMSPSIGTTGTIINISGSNFPATAGITVTVNGVATPVIYSTANQIQVAVKPNTGSGNVLVTFGGNTYNAGRFEYRYTNYTLATISSGNAVYADGPLATAGFPFLYGITIDGSNNIYSATGNRLRKIDMNVTARTVTTVAGSGVSGDVDGTGAGASFGSVRQLSSSANGTVYIADRTFRKIKKIDPTGVLTTFAALNYIDAAGNPTGATFVPEGIKVAKSGNVYVTGSNVIQKFNPSGVLQWEIKSHGTGNTDGDSAAVKFKTGNGIEIDSAETKLYFLHQPTANPYPTYLKVLNLSKLSTSTLITTNIQWVTSMVLDENGGLYLADYFGYIWYYNTSKVLTLVKGNSDGISGAWGIVRDKSGNIVFTDNDYNVFMYLTRVQ